LRDEDVTEGVYDDGAYDDGALEEAEAETNEGVLGPPYPYPWPWLLEGPTDTDVMDEAILEVREVVLRRRGS
jgi:hypothetical protein